MIQVRFGVGAERRERGVVTIQKEELIVCASFLFSILMCSGPEMCPGISSF
jgi:hypothetical protein